jgi:hypothetical protein
VNDTNCYVSEITLIRTLATFGSAKKISEPVCDWCCSLATYPNISDLVFWLVLSLLFFLQNWFYDGFDSVVRSVLLYLMPVLGGILILVVLPLNPMMSRRNGNENETPCSRMNSVIHLTGTSQAIVQAFNMHFVSDPTVNGVSGARPPVVFLADGGHYENSGLLYLMEQVVLMCARVGDCFEHFTASPGKIRGLQTHYFHEW